MAFLKKKNKKLEVKDKWFNKDLTFTPEICQNSRAISARSSMSRSQIRDRPWVANTSNRSTDSLAGGGSSTLFS